MIRDVAQLLECLHKALGLILSVTKSGMVAHVYSVKLLGVQGEG